MDPPQRLVLVVVRCWCVRGARRGGGGGGKRRSHVPVIHFGTTRLAVERRTLRGVVVTLACSFSGRGCRYINVRHRRASTTRLLLRKCQCERKRERTREREKEGQKERDRERERENRRYTKEERETGGRVCGRKCEWFFAAVPRRIKETETRRIS